MYCSISFLAMLMIKQLEEEMVDSAAKTRLNKERRDYSLLLYGHLSLTGNLESFTDYRNPHNLVNMLPSNNILKVKNRLLCQLHCLPSQPPIEETTTNK